MLETFWDLLWFTIVVFFFVAYLIILFQIIADMFRDRSMSAIARILWIIALVVVPYITAFVYLLARGRGMTERQISAHADSQKAVEAYIRDIAGRTPADEIATAKALLDAGTISEEEFRGIKAKALA